MLFRYIRSGVAVTITNLNYGGKIMTREEFVSKGVETMKYMIMDSLEQNLNRAIDTNVVKLEDQPEDYTAVYPTLAAILLQNADHILYGSTNESTQKRMKRETNRIKRSARF